MTYTPDDLDAAALAVHHAWKNGQHGTAGVAEAVLDAVLPGYTQRIQAEALLDAREIIPYSDHRCFKPTCPECRERSVNERFKAALIARAAALAAPVERPLCRETLDQNSVTYRCSMLSGHDENFHEGVPLPLAWTAPPVEQP